MKKRIFSLVLAIVLAVTMGIPAFAFSSGPYPPMIYADGSRGEGASDNINYGTENFPYRLYADEFYKENSITYYGGTFYVGIGKTITLRLLQRDANFGLSSDDNKWLSFYWLDGKGGDDHDHIKFTNLTRKKLGDNFTMAQLPTQTVTAADGTKYKSPYIEYTFTGVSNGVVEIASNVPGIGNLALYHIVVGSGKASANNNEESTPDSTGKKFELKKLQSGVKAIATELGNKRLYDLHVAAVNNQLTYLNGEIAAKKKPANEAEIKKALQDLDKLLKKIDITKLSVYTKPDTAKKTDKAGLDATQKRLGAARKNLDKAIKAIG